MAVLRLGGALATLAVLVLMAPQPFTHRWDERFTVWLQRTAPAPTGLASILVYLGNAEVVILAVTLVAGLLLLRNKRSGIAALWLAGGFIIASLIAFVLKYLIVHPGPPGWFQHRHGLAFGLYAAAPYSFPSGHAMRTTLLAGTALRTVPWVAGVLVLSMMAALVYLGDHWLSDVLGGLCLGWVLIEIVRLIGSACSRSRRQE